MGAEVVDPFEAMGGWGWCLPCRRLVLTEVNEDGETVLTGHNITVTNYLTPCEGGHEKPWPTPTNREAEAPYDKLYGYKHNDGFTHGGTWAAEGCDCSDGSCSAHT